MSLMTTQISLTCPGLIAGVTSQSKSANGAFVQPQNRPLTCTLAISEIEGIRSKNERPFSPAGTLTRVR